MPRAWRGITYQGEITWGATQRNSSLCQAWGGANSNASIQTHAERRVNTRNLETCTHLQGYDLTDSGKMWWEGSYDWSAGVEGCRLFRKDRLGRQGEDVNDQLECIGMDEELTENLGVMDSWHYTGALLQLTQEYWAGDWYRQTGEAPHSQVLILMADFNHPKICWNNNPGGSWNSLVLTFFCEWEEPTRRGAMLGLLLTNREGLVTNVKLKDSLDCSGHDMMECKILRAARMALSKPPTPDFRTVDSSEICLVDYHGI